MANELKGCPFCNKPVTYIYNSRDDAFKFSHKYGDDEEKCCVIGEIWLKGKSLADARNKWNRRATDGE
jgi:hypothetical protein